MSRFKRLQPYPFERLRRLTQGVEPPPDLRAIALSIGEPQHPVPGFIRESLIANLSGLAQYPLTAGGREIREACAGWLTRRFGLRPESLDTETMVLPVNGTREALFALAQSVIEPADGAVVVMPNPFYQIYEGAALLAGAEPYFVNTTRENAFLPDLDSVPAAIWARCRLLYLCTPGNPAGAICSTALLRRAIELAERHNFVIASDECYAELYRSDDAPPPSLLNAAIAAGHLRFERCIAFHSLSKRSSVPGLRSGFVAGDPALLARFLLYRTYHGSAMPLPVQAASAAAWRDDAHARENRELYRRKFREVLAVIGSALAVEEPQGGFYLWAAVGGDDEAFARGLLARQNVLVLPGSYLAREAHGMHPGRGYVRISLVASIADCVEAAHRISRYMEEHQR